MHKVELSTMEKKAMRKGEKCALFLMALTLSLGLGFWGYYHYIKKGLYETTQQQLVSIANNRADRILEHLKKYLNQGLLRIADTFTLDEIQRLSTLKLEELSSEENKQKAQRFATFLEERSSEPTFNNTLVISPEGIVVFTHWEHEYLGKDLTKAPYANYALGESFIRAKMSLTTDISDLFFDPVLNRPALFISIPILHNEKFIGMFVQRVPREPLYAIAEDYIGLATTGQIILSEKVKNGLLFLNRTRIEKTSPFKKFLFLNETENLSPLQHASQGERGHGLTLDYMQKKVFAAWRFIPKVNWGMLVEITESEVNDTLKYWSFIGYLFLLLCVVLLLIFGLYFNWFLLFFSFVYFYLSKSWVRGVILLIAFSGIAFAIYSLLNQFYIKREQLHNSALYKVQTAQEKIDFILKTSETTVENLAYDLGAQRIGKDELFPRLKRELTEHSEIYSITVAYEPFAYSPEKKLYAPFVKRSKDGFQTDYLEESYDYTHVQEEESDDETAAYQSWYKTALKNKKATLFDPYREPTLNEAMLFPVAAPFYKLEDKNKEKPLGVINFLFKMDALEKIVSQLTVGETGYAYMMAKDGRVIVYPIKSYVSDQVTGEEIAGELGSASLLRMTKEALSGKTGFGLYEDKTLVQRMWMYYSPVSLTGWPIMLVFSEQEIMLAPLELRHYSIWLLLLCAFVAFFILWIGTNYSVIRRGLAYWLLIVEVLVLLIFFIIIRASMISQQAEDVTAVLNKVHLNKFLDERDQYAQNINEPLPIKVPFGIYLYTINFPNPTLLNVSGYVWLKYPATIDKKLIQEPQFPQAIGKVNLLKSYEVHEKDFIVLGWQFTMDISQDFDFSTYPFDLLNVRIDVEHPDISHNILFVPALDDYRDVRPEKLPGIYPGLLLSGFSMQKSFFSFYKEPGDSNLGLQSFQNTSDRAYLSYNLMLQRHLFYELIVFVLPIFIVLLLLFALSWVAEKEWLPIMILSGYTGLLFSTILLHRALRQRYTSADVLYLEYPFFMIYLTIVLLVTYILYKLYFVGKNSRILITFAWYRTYFWSIQLAILFIITMIIFYNA